MVDGRDQYIVDIRLCMTHVAPGGCCLPGRYQDIVKYVTAPALASQLQTAGMPQDTTVTLVLASFIRGYACT